MTTTQTFRLPMTVDDRTCGACHEIFPTINEVFSHDCHALGQTTHSRLGAGLCSVDAPARGTGGTSRTTTRPARTNKFAADCATCGQRVAAETGTLTNENGKWVVRHQGVCPEIVAVVAPVIVQTPTPTLVDVPDGHYAIESTGHNDLAFYRVTHSPKWGVSVQLVVGGHTDMFVVRRNVPGILARIAQDAPAAAKTYADEIGRCYVCNRHLTDETSRKNGIGPECAKKGAGF